MVFLRLSQYQVKRDNRFTRLYVYHEYRISFPIVFQSYPTVRVYCSIARHSYPVVCESYPIINLVKKKITLPVLYTSICMYRYRDIFLSFKFKCHLL